jgi:phosphopantothenoylcysteine decarboxylase/phosphopantothenate--cysteine ligase
MRVALEENEDIIGSVTAAFDNTDGADNADNAAGVAGQQGPVPRPFVVGFAAETHDALAYARDKRRRKRMDAIVVNDVSDTTIGFDSTDNAVTLIHEGGEIAIGKMPKTAVAARLVQEVAALHASSGRA